MPKQLQEPEAAETAAGTAPARRKKRNRAVLFTEIPRELDKTIKLICVDKGVSRSAWLRKLVVAKVRTEAQRLGLKVDFLTGEARLRETGKVLPGMGEPEKGERD